MRAPHGCHGHPIRDPRQVRGVGGLPLPPHHPPMPNCGERSGRVDAQPLRGVRRTPFVPPVRGEGKWSGSSRRICRIPAANQRCLCEISTGKNEFFTAIGPMRGLGGCRVISSRPQQGRSPERTRATITAVFAEPTQQLRTTR